jgi:hypothetical protein
MVDLLDTFSLSFNDLIVVRISASNLMGQGPWSISNTGGALVKTVPEKMLAVTKGTASTASSL